MKCPDCEHELSATEVRSSTTATKKGRLRHAAITRMLKFGRAHSIQLACGHQFGATALTVLSLGAFSGRRYLMGNFEESSLIRFVFHGQFMFKPVKQEWHLCIVDQSPDGVGGKHIGDNHKSIK